MNLANDPVSPVYIVIPAAGAGTRMNAGLNKQFLEIGRYPVIIRTLLTFDNHPAVTGCLVVAAPDEVKAMRMLIDRFALTKCLGVTAGGETRTRSVFNGLAAIAGIASRHPGSLVLVHDGARCFVTPDVISRVIGGIGKYGACGAAVPVKDTIKQAGPDGSVLQTLDRSRLWAMQTPQGAAFEHLYSACENAIKKDLTATDDLAVLELAGIPVHLVMGDYLNIKLTTPDDRLVAEQLARLIDEKGD